MITNLLAVFLQVELEDKKAMMRTPIINKGCRKVIDPNDDLYAWHFLCDVLQEKGHDIAWLALRTEPLFIQRVDEMMLGESPVVQV